MFFRRNRFNKIKRSEVVNQIIEFGSERDLIEQKMIDKSKVIQSLYQQGAKERNTETRRMLAGKIKRLKQEGETDLKRLMFLNYNIQVLEKLKVAIDDATFFKKQDNQIINQALKDTNGLNAFLNKAYQIRHEAEETLSESNRIFDEYESSFSSVSDIYAFSKEEDQILSEFDQGIYDASDTLDFEKEIDPKDKEVS